MNYGTKFAQLNLSLPQNVDWTSFDCYGPFDNCWGTGASITQIVDIAASKLPNAQTQSIFLVPDASCFFYDATGRKTHESELFLRALEYWQLATTHPRVKGLIPFLWDGNACMSRLPADTINDIKDSPGLSTLYQHIGLNVLTGAIPSVPTLGVPPTCNIPNGGSACTVNLTWGVPGNPNAGVWARLVGDADAVFGPLCPGATACSLPAFPGDYIIELRANWGDANSKLLWASPIEVRYGNGTPTGQFTFTPSTCGIGCVLALTANVQNAPSAGIFMAGQAASFCGTGRTNMCVYAGGLPPAGATYPFTVELRADGNNPASALLAQRTFSLTITQ